MTESSLTSHELLVRELAPWTETLRGMLSLPIRDAAPHSSDLVDKLWVQLKVPPTGFARDYVPWVQALRLLDLFAGIDRLACWQLIFDLCDAHERLRKLGCPLEFFMEVRPRFELRFIKRVAPRDPFTDGSLVAVQAHLELLYGERPASYSDIMALFGSGGRRSGDDDDFSRLETEMSGRIQERLGAPPDATPIRCLFTIRSREHSRSCLRSGCDDEPVVELLTQVLRCANRIATQGATTPSPFEVQSFSFNLREVCGTARVLESLRQIGCNIPFDTLQLKGSDISFGDKSYAAFAWRLFAPHDNAHGHFGLRHLEVFDAEKQCYEAMCAAIHSSRSLEEVSLADDGWSHLAFTLFSKTAQHRIHTLKITTTWMSRFFVSAIQSIFDREKRRLVGISHYPTDVGLEWPPVTARVDPQVKLRHPSGQLRRAMTVHHGKRPVDCLLVGHQADEDLAEVLMPGVGVAYVARKDVLSQQPVTLRDSHTIRNLTINVVASDTAGRPEFDTEPVIMFLKLVGEPLEQLTIACAGDRPKDAICVDDILEHCPNLKRLMLVNLTLAAKELFSSNHGRALQSLTLLTCYLNDKPRRMSYDFHVAPRTFPRLTSLYIDSSGFARVPELARVYDCILELAVGRNLHRLVVGCGDDMRRDRFAEEVARHDGNLIPMLPLRDKLALLSVVTVGPSASNTAKYALSMDVAQMVFEFASTATWHRRVWTLLE